MLVMDPGTLEVEPSRPQVVHTEDSGRTIALSLRPGESMQEHQTRERAYLVVASGKIGVKLPDGSEQALGPGGTAIFEPGERRELTAAEATKILIRLTPWPAPAA